MSEETRGKEGKIEKIWCSLVKKFGRKPIEFNFKKVVSESLKIENSAIYAHSLHYYPAKMFAFIPRFFFSLSEICPPNGKVLDPFCGSGTVLLESITHPLYKRSAYGVEINPLGRLITKVKVTPLPEDELSEKIDHLLNSIKKLDNSSKEARTPKFKNLNFWFSKKAIEKLSILRSLIEEEIEEDCYRDFFWVCFSSTVRKASYADPFIPPPVKLKPEKYANSKSKWRLLKEFIKQIDDPNVIEVFSNKVRENFEKIKPLWKTEEIKNGKIKARVIWDDAREIRVGELDGRGRMLKNHCRKLPSGSIDFILTSPPYLTAQKYIRTNKLELLWLGYSSEELQRLEKESIGTEVVSENEFNLFSELGVKSVDNLINWARKKNPQRGFMLLKYFTGMHQAILEMHRILKDEAYAIIVIGSNKVLGKSVQTYKLLVDIAKEVGFDVKLILKDKIRGRGMITKRHDTGGLIEEEFITVLKKH